MSKDFGSDPYKSGQWAAQPQGQQYPPPPQQGGYPAPSPYNQPPPHYYQPVQTAGDMLSLPPPPPPAQQGHLPPQDPYRGHPQYDSYQQGPPGQPMPYPPSHHPGHQQQAVNFSQPAPRQRTAIACRYCRRRKIRCHGFDLSPDGRCTNCARFHQECIFTPVSSQAHAFVPAHTAYPHLRTATGRAPDGRPLFPQNQPVIYGAHGQPLGPLGQPAHDPNYPPPQMPPQPYGPGPYPGYDDRGPPPHPQDPSRGGAPARRSSGAAYEYPDPTHMAPVSPASSTTSYQSAPYPPQAQQPYYPPQQPARRPSPPTSYAYGDRSSTSPQGSASSATTFGTYPGGLHPPQVLPQYSEAGRTPPPSAGRDGTGNAATNGSRPGMSVRDMLSSGENGGARSSADSDMLKALNKRGM